MDKSTSELRELIEAKNKELLSEIAETLSKDDLEGYNHLKMLQIQCSAELRLLNHLESNEDNSKFIIC